MASLSYQLRNIYTEIQLLKEIGEGTSKPYQYKKINDFKYTFMARLGTNVKEEVRVDFQDISNSKFKDKLLQNIFPKVITLYNVGYKVSEDEYQHSKSNIGSLLRIVTTVSTIVKEFIDNNDPDGIFIIGNAKMTGLDGHQKNDLYKAFVYKQLDKIPEYSAQERMNGHFLYKSKLVKK